MELADLQKRYGEKAKQYKLPSFKELNEDFEIEKLDKESQLLLKMVRKMMMEKVIHSLGFLELLFNPVNAPRLYMRGLSSFTPEHKQTLETLYASFGKLSLESFKLDITYSEKQEAAMVKQIFEVWETSKAAFIILVNALATTRANENQRERQYFG